MMICFTGCDNLDGSNSNLKPLQPPENCVFSFFDTYEELDEWFATDENGIAPAMEEMENDAPVMEMKKPGQYW